MAENDIRAALVTQPNIANVEIFGGYEPALRIDFDLLKLARYHISTAQLQEAVSKMNRDWPLGNLQGKSSSLTLTVYGERADLGKLRQLPLTRDITLGDVATVRLAHADRYAAYRRASASRSCARRAARCRRRLATPKAYCRRAARRARRLHCGARFDTTALPTDPDDCFRHHRWPDPDRPATRRRPRADVAAGCGC